jgi:cytochrome c553
MPMSLNHRSWSLRSSSLLLALAGLGACTGDGPAPTAAPPDNGGAIPAGPPAAAPPVAPDPSAANLPPPISGGTLLVMRDGLTAVAADPDRDKVYVVDLEAHSLRATIPVAAGAQPGRVIEDGDGRAHVALRGGGAVLSLDPRDGRVLAQRALCPAPRGLAWDAAQGLLHVACAGGELVSIGALDETPRRTVQLDRDLRDVLVAGSNLLVTTFRKAEVLVVGPAGLLARQAPEPQVAAFNNFLGKRGPAPSSSGVLPTGMASPGVAWRMIPAPAGAASQQAMILHQRGVDDEVGTTPSAYGGGPSCTGVVESAVSSFEVSASGGLVASKLRSGAALGNVVLAVDMALSPDGRQLAVVAAGQSGADGPQVLFYNMGDATAPATRDRPCVPGSGTPMPPPDPEPVEYRPPNGEVTAVAFDNRGNVLVQSREPATLQILTRRVAPIVLSNEVRADRGHQLFHNATSGKLACASCHPEGGEDGRTWRFAGLGARRTQSLRGGIMDTAPFHWNGDMPTLDHLMHDVFQGRMSGPSVDREEIRSLARWLDNVPSIKPSSWHTAEAIARGRALFESAAIGCAACHRGRDFTSGATFDVGTGGAFQVPQLHSLAFRAPFLHDGCAGTLTARFTTCGGGDRHGFTSRLGEAQIADLVAYLESL